MKPLGVGLIGTGYMGKCHALAWNAVKAVFGDVPRPRLVHLAEANAELATARADEFGFEKATANWRRLIDDPDVDVVSVTTPNQFHAEMAIAALGAGKHVWCEKPMSPTFPDAQRMLKAVEASGKIAIMGYNYIQNPILRHMKTLIEDGAIGAVNHVRVEMDEDFMADPEAPFYWKSERSAGYGALDDFAVHPLSLLWYLFGHVRSVVTDMAKPYADRPLKDGGRRAVENHDGASILMRLEHGISAVLMANRAAWGRKGRIALQIYGSKGSILYDQERMNEFELYQTGGNTTEQGFRRVLTAPSHAPYGQFIPAPGHGLGFNDLKIIECHELIRAIAGEPFSAIDFKQGLRIEKTVHAMARSFDEKAWIEVDKVEIGASL
ncbi:Gfo/Idh/MocA family oxidoreductase [Rhizobium sp. LjRoot98]|uniref:Gfo/Idh/MocA family protein n=1 Tax=unclassified Rhizobium TaxID=2613769 RepID=UPI000714DEE9|nr:MULTISPECIES: Gfo/Idh/MocA family oxidoreductase [unclassified Rhizobium]KQV40421.1 myo-inositol 2-dehydrogenase [Rhizobium sp. Root1204]KQY02782.1 myo-inositol 2-dehydrogenase [Rhizobium sp. Root1334]KRB99388.1 myo-inositol 2-dehydrogenase [Rhizobium sp. Root73]